MKYIFIFFITLINQISFSQTNSETKKDSIKFNISFTVNEKGIIEKVKNKDVECNNCTRKERNEMKKEVQKVLKNIPPIETNGKRVRFLLPIIMKSED